jgi:catechol 2,3-dioxygenase-like lactoylglutathione lyase family enzyme
MRMLHIGLRVSDLEQSLAFYSARGYAELGSVPQTEFGSLTMLQLPDDPFVSLELVHHPERPVDDVGAVNHLVVQVDDLDATIADLGAKGVAAAPPAEPGPRIRTSWLTDRRLLDRTRAVASRSSGRHDGRRLCPLTGRVKPALPVLESR